MPPYNMTEFRERPTDLLPRVVRVIVDGYGRTHYTYLAPSDIKVGDRVRVPFGHTDREVGGTVVSFGSGYGGPVKSIIGKVEPTYRVVISGLSRGEADMIGAYQGTNARVEVER